MQSDDNQLLYISILKCMEFLKDNVHKFFHCVAIRLSLALLQDFHFTRECRIKNMIIKRVENKKL